MIFKWYLFFFIYTRLILHIHTLIGNYKNQHILKKNKIFVRYEQKVKKMYTKKQEPKSVSTLKN